MRWRDGGEGIVVAVAYNLSQLEQSRKHSHIQHVASTTINSVELMVRDNEVARQADGSRNEEVALTCLASKAQTGESSGHHQHRQ